MSKHSEIIGSFKRMGNFPIEADFEFQNEAALKEFYSDPIQYATLHRGLLKLVKDDGTGKQALYWVIKNNEKLEFTKLINGDYVKEIAPKLNKLIEDLAYEIQERLNGDSAIWGTSNPTIIPENLNSILDLSEAFAKLKEEFEEGSVGALEGLISEAYYDADIESLVMVFTLDNGKTRKMSIPFTNLIREWDVDNHYPHKVVELTREEVYSGGADRLSADVRISTRTDNILERDGNTLLVKGTTDNIDHNGTALNVVIRRLNKRLQELEKIIEECGCGEEEVIIPVDIISFTCDLPSDNGVVTVEVGQTINPTFTWVYNISKVDTQTLNNTAVDLAARSKLLTGIKSDTSVTLFAAYRGYTASRELQFKFVPRIYWGTSSEENLFNVSQLNSKLGAELSQALYDCSGGKYAYYAIPTSYKNRVQFMISSFPMTAYTTKTVNLTNENGEYIEYTIFRLDNKYYGQFNMDVNLI